jgi:hypothetical protein
MAAAESGPGRLPDPDTPFLIPDDASGLEADRQAWLAEQRQVRRRRRLRRLLFTRRWERFGLSGPIVVLCLTVVTMIGALAVAVIPRADLGPPPALPLASAPVASVPAATGAGGATGAAPAVEPDGGTVLGHRLPAVMLDGDSRAVSTLALRPAVLVLIPSRCDCAPLVGEIYRQTREFRVPTWLIAAGPGPATRDSLVRLDEEAAGGGARWAVDSGETLGRTLAAHGATLVAVRADGLVSGLRRDLSLDPADLPALEPLVAKLALATR